MAVVASFAASVVASFAACSAASGPQKRVGDKGASGGAGGGLGGTAGSISVGGGFGIDPSGAGGGSGAGTPGTSPGGSLDECPGALDAQTVAALDAGGPVAAGMRWLYPYDKTVFPRGLLPPVLQWEGPAPQAVLLRMRSNTFSYRGCFGPSPNRLPIPDNAWKLATGAASGVSDPLIVELVTAANGQVSGPITQTWAIAPATIKGSIFYNTYTSPQVANNGAVMRINPGQTTPQPYLTYAGFSQFPLGPCYSCHSLSANGQRMVAAYHQYPGVYTSASYDVTAQTNPPARAQNLDEAGFAAVFPDGSRILTSGTPNPTAGFNAYPMAPGNLVAMVGPRESRLFDATTGQQLQAPGWSVRYAQMPSFSPDGRKVVFNNYDAGQGHSLGVMDFDPATNTFSNLQEIFRDPVRFPGWPFFTPDSAKVVFALGTADDFVGAHPMRPVVAQSDLFIVDLATKTANPLSRANGFEGTQSYLPYPGRDEHWEFFPTVSPVAAGGYFWLFFTSRRNYGNTIVGAADLPPSKKIWVSAIDIDAPPGTDPSHPAFYLPGQEAESGNVRAFAALEPCKPNGDSCSSGIDCCCGGCETGVCGCPIECAKLDEKCNTSADCCDPALSCIGGFCAMVIPH